MKTVFFYLYLPLPSSSSLGMDPILNLMKGGDNTTLHRSQMGPQRVSNQFLLDKDEDKKPQKNNNRQTDMCTVLMIFMQMEEYKCVREGWKEVFIMENLTTGWHSS